jgi:hypothetical protein
VNTNALTMADFYRIQAERDRELMVVYGVLAIIALVAIVIFRKRRQRKEPLPPPFNSH